MFKTFKTKLNSNKLECLLDTVRDYFLEFQNNFEDYCRTQAKLKIDQLDMGDDLFSAFNKLNLYISETKSYFEASVQYCNIWFQDFYTMYQNISRRFKYIEGMGHQDNEMKAIIQELYNCLDKLNHAIEKFNEDPKHKFYFIGQPVTQ